MSGSLGITPTMESEREERKEAWQSNGLEALAALANTRGGTLWIGVRDNGNPLEPNGWPDAGVAGKMEAITNQIVSKLGIHPESVTVETLKGKPVLAIQMGRAPAPVVLDSHYWRRVGNSSRKVPSEELTRFLLERTGTHWDGLPCAASLAALDPKTLEDFKVEGRERLPKMRPSDDAETVLGNLGLLGEDGRLSRAAVLLFGKDQEVQRLSPTAFVQVGRFKGNGSAITDDRRIPGNLFAQINGVMEALRIYLQVRYEFPTEIGEREGTSALQRIEVWEYPLTALREAVANALIHRDYTSSGRVMIRVYDDHILITSPGPLPDGVAVADLSRNPHRSRLRNPLLARTFFFAKIVESWGSGTTRMGDLCAQQGLPAPEFTEDGDEVWVTFRKDPYTDTRLRTLGLSERQIKAVRFVQERGSISNAEYRELTGVLDRTALRDLKTLAKLGVFTEPEIGRQSHYVLEAIKPDKADTKPT